MYRVLQRNLLVLCRGLRGDMQIKPFSGGKMGAEPVRLVAEKGRPRSLNPVVQNRRLYSQGGAFLACANLHSFLSVQKLR